jgi:NCS1 family nucleobase:cation symporter-1
LKVYRRACGLTDYFSQIIAKWPSRAARFFAACAFMLAQAGTNLSTNAIASQNDLTMLFPKSVILLVFLVKSNADSTFYLRWFNLRRGALFTAVCVSSASFPTAQPWGWHRHSIPLRSIGGWATAPWKIQASGATLLAFLSSYVIFLAPILSILLCDFYIIKKQHLSVPDLYRPDGIYTYNNRCKANWRAFITLFIVVVRIQILTLWVGLATDLKTIFVGPQPINLPGLAHAIVRPFIPRLTLS